MYMSKQAKVKEITSILMQQKVQIANLRNRRCALEHLEEDELNLRIWRNVNALDKLQRQKKYLKHCPFIPLDENRP